MVDWHFFDPDSGSIPDAARPSVLPGGGKGRIVVLAATPHSARNDWACRATVEIARAWAHSGLRIFLMDLGLEEPRLHEALGMENVEGVSDAFAYGASVQRIARPALDGAIFFASAGTVTADAESVLSHRRWTDLAGGFSEADATLLLYLPVRTPGADRILSLATDVILFAGQGENPDDALGPASIKVVSLLGPMGDVRPEDALVPATGEPGAPEEAPGEPAPEPSGEEAPGAAEDVFGDLSLAAAFGEAGPEEEGAEEVETFDLGGELVLEGMEPAEEGPAEEAPGELVPGGDDLGVVMELEGKEAPPAEEEIPDFSGDIVLEGAGEPGVVGPGAPEGPMEGFVPGFEQPLGEPGVAAPDFGAEFGEVPVEGTPGGFELEPPAPDSGFGDSFVRGAGVGGAPPGAGPEPPTVEAPYESAAREEAPVGREERREEERPAPPPRPPRRPPPKRRFPVALVVGGVAVLAVVGVLGGVAFGYLNIPALAFLQDYVGEPPEPPLSVPGPEPTEAVVRFSLLLDTYRDRATAVEMADALEARLPDLLFVVVPRLQEGETVYDLLAGPALDRIEALDLKGPLAEVLTREDPESWAIVETPRAFLLGERGSREEAERLAADLAGRGIGAYVLRVSYPDGSEAFRVYSGAFAGVEDAGALQRLLRRHGYREVPLVERRGQLPG